MTCVKQKDQKSLTTQIEIKDICVSLGVKTNTRIEIVVLTNMHWNLSIDLYNTSVDTLKSFEELRTHKKYVAMI